MQSPRRQTRADSIVPCGAAQLVYAQNLARIQNALRIEGCFERVHGRQFDRVGAARELRSLEAADAVLGADAAAEALDEIEHRRFERMRPAQESCHALAGLLAQVEVQIAVPR